MKSKRKGKDGELDLSGELRRLGFIDARRGVQYHGGPDSPDVVGVEGVHLEVKRCEKLSLYEALDQAMSEAPVGSVPVVVHRRNRKPWLVIVPLDLTVSFAIRWLNALDYEVRRPSVTYIDVHTGQALHELPEEARSLREAAP